MEHKHKGVSLTSDQDIPIEEAERYIERGLERHPTLSAIVAEVDGDYVGLEYHFTTYQPFERIRRITGYLVGTLDRWNDGKRAEEHDRVKHGVEITD